MSKLKIKNIGPIEEINISVPADGGVIVLRGRNGSGKSHALDATRALLSGKGSLPVRDGELKGEVEGFGARITVARSTRRTGECEVSHIEGRYDPSVLADPGINDPTAADARRIRSLVALSGLSLDVEELSTILPGGPNDLEALVKPSSIKPDDPVATCAAVKRDLEAHARLIEGQVEAAEARAKAHLANVDGVEIDRPSDAAALQDALEVALSRRATVKERAAQSEAAKQRWQGAREELDRAENEYDGPTSEAAEKSLKEAADKLAAKEVEVSDLLARLQLVESQRDELEVARNNFEVAVHNAKSHESTLERARRAVKEAVGVPAPTAAEIESAEAAVNDARDNMDYGATVRAAIRHKADADREIEAATNLRQRAESLRSASLKTDEVLSGMVARSGCALLVEGGRLVLRTDRGKEYFAELSEGERWAIAMETAINAAGSRGVLVVPQPAWEGLDPDNQKMIAGKVFESNSLLLTAGVSDGELSYEVLG